MVAGRKRGQRDLLVARLLAQALCFIFYGIYVFLSERAVDKARLTEAAAAYAAAQHLDNCSVVDYLCEWHNKGIGVIHIVKVRNNALCDLCRCLLDIRSYRADGTIIIIGDIIELRNVHAAYLHSLLEKLELCTALPFHIFIQLEQLDVYLLALADNEQVKKICHRLGVAHAGTASDNYRHIVTALARKHGNARKVEHFKHVVV